MKRIEERIEDALCASRKRIKLETDLQQEQQHRLIRYGDSNGDFSYSLDVTELASDCHEEVCSTSSGLLSEIIRVESPPVLSPRTAVEASAVQGGDVLPDEEVPLRPKSNFRARSSSDVPSTNRLQFACAVCDRYFSSEKYLSMHLSLHKPNMFSSSSSDTSNSFGRNEGSIENGDALNKQVTGGLNSNYGGAIAPRTCNFCNKTFTQNSNYKNHMRTHDDERPFVCTTCSIGFKERYHLKKHILFKHTTDLKETCKICGKCFKDSTAVRAHERIHSEARPYGCPICSKSFKTSECLWHHENRSKTCGKALLSHRENSGAQLACKGSSRRARRSQPSPSTEEIPMKQEVIDNNSGAVTSLDNNVLLSNYITLNFGQIQDLNTIPEMTAPGICMDGNSMTYDPQTLVTANEYIKELLLQKLEGFAAELDAAETNSMVLEDTFSTDTADSEAASPLATPSNNETKVSTAASGLDCTKCEKHFLSAATLEKHMAMHCEDRPYRCDLCDNGFKLKVHLKKHHLYRHSDEYPCECSICGKKFKDSSAVRLHERIHSMERPFECHCGKSFKTRENLWGHRNRGPCEKSQDFVANNMQLFRSEEFGPIIGVPITSTAILQHFSGFLQSINFANGAMKNNNGDVSCKNEAQQANLFNLRLNNVQSIPCGGEVKLINKSSEVNRVLPNNVGSIQKSSAEELLTSNNWSIKQRAIAATLPTAIVSPTHRSVPLKQEVANDARTDRELNAVILPESATQTTPRAAIPVLKTGGSVQAAVQSVNSSLIGKDTAAIKSELIVVADKCAANNNSVLINSRQQQQLPPNNPQQTTGLQQSNVSTQRTILPKKIKADLILGLKAKRAQDAQQMVIRKESIPEIIDASGGSRKESVTGKCPTVHKFLMTLSRSNVIVPDIEKLIENHSSSSVEKGSAQFDEHTADVDDSSLRMLEDELYFDDIQLNEDVTCLLNDDNVESTLCMDPILSNSSLAADYPEPLSPSLSDYSMGRLDESDSLSDITDIWMEGDNVLSQYWSSDSESLFTGLSPSSTFDHLTA